MNYSTAYLSGQKIYKYHEDLATSVVAKEPHSTWHQLHVRPNPTDGVITIGLTLDRNTIADLRIFAANGITLQQLLKRNATKGEYSFTADLDGDAGATYFVVLKSNEGMRYENVMLSK